MVSQPAHVSWQQRKGMALEWGALKQMTRNTPRHIAFHVCSSLLYTSISGHGLFSMATKPSKQAKTRHRNLDFAPLLATSTSSLHLTLALLNEPAVASGQKVAWSDVKKAADQVAKQATAAGVLWSGDLQEKAGVENIRASTKSLQGFLILCHGSTAGAGPTLLHAVRNAAKQIVDTTLNLLNSAIHIGKRKGEHDTDLPMLVGCVWEACEALKRTPPDNYSAIGRGLTQAAASVKDVIRELGDFKQAIVSGHHDEVDTTLEGKEDGDKDANDSASSASNFDFNDGLSVEEMQVVQSVKCFVSSLLDVFKQLLYFVADVSRKSKADGSEYPVSFLEKILELSKGLGIETDELGASLYPPQEVELMKERVSNMEKLIDTLQAEVCVMDGSIPDTIRVAFDMLRESQTALEKILDSVSPV